MEYNEMAAIRRKKLQSDAFMRLLRLFAAILLSHPVAYAAAFSVSISQKGPHLVMRHHVVTQQVVMAMAKDDSECQINPAFIILAR
jgi:hypothetical protein